MKKPLNRQLYFDKILALNTSVKTKVTYNLNTVYCYHVLKNAWYREHPLKYQQQI